MKPRKNTKTGKSNGERSASSTGIDYKYLLNISKDGIHILDEKGFVIEVNQAFCDLLGYTSEEVKKMNVADWDVHWNNVELSGKLVELIANPSIFETQYRCNDKSLKDVEINTNSFILDGQKYLYASARDITKRKSVAGLVQRNEHFYLSLLSKLNPFAYLKVLDGDKGQIDFLFLMVNNYFEAQTGLMNVSGKKFTEVIPDARENCPRIFEICKRVISTGNAEKFDLFFKEKIAWFSISVHCLNQGYLFAVLDSITQRKQAELIKEESYNQLRKIASQVPGIIYQFQLNPDGSSCFPYVSENLFEVYHIHPEDVKNDTSAIFSVIHPDDLEDVMESIQVSAKNLSQWNYEFRIKYHNGTVRILSGNSVPQREQDGSVIWYGFITDITEKKKKDALHEEAKNQLRKISKLVPGVIYQYRLYPDGSSGFPFISDVFNHMFKERGTKIQRDGSKILEGILPEDRDAFITSVAISAKELSPWQHEFRIQSDDEKIHTVYGSSIPQRESDGSILWNGFITDITKLRNTQDKVRQFSQAVEQSPVSILITDTTGAIEYANKKFITTSGYSFEELIGQNPRFLKSGYKTDEEYKELWQSILNGNEWHGEFYNKKKDGSYYWESASISPILNSEGKIVQFLEIKEDITARKIAEAQLKNYADELKKSNKDLENFAYVASHDLQEPIRMVSSFLNLLSKKLEGQLDETSEKYIHFAIDGAERMKILINDLLQYSKVGNNKEKFSATNVNEVLLYIIHVLKESIENCGAVIIVKQMPVINANKLLINELFLNLINNALKYRGERMPEIEVGCTEEPGQNVFYVRDNGIGISAGNFEKIFVIFQRLHGKGEYSGTGIGLALCKKIVEIHNGRIWVESEKGMGSTFYFSIPVISGKAVL